MNSAVTLASIYMTGYKNVPIDMKKAVRYYTIAADAGWGNAQGQLGYLLATAPEGVTPDPQKAFSLLTMADRRQDSIGTVGLGYCYFKGIGVSSKTLLILILIYTYILDNNMISLDDC